MTTRENLLTILRENPRTITELSNDLGLARNAVTLQLDRLVREGIVLKGEMRPAQSAGKPAQEYRIAPGTEDLYSTAYVPFISSFLEILPEHLSQQERKALLEKVGKHMADHANINQELPFEEKLQLALAIVNELGATAELIEEEDHYIVRNMTCPLASAVRKEPCVCHSVAAFFQAATGSKTTAGCHIGEQLVCRYIIKK